MQLLVEEVSERQLALIISSHHLQELEKIADVVMMMKDTRIDSVISIEDVKQSFKKCRLHSRMHRPTLYSKRSIWKCCRRLDV